MIRVSVTSSYDGGNISTVHVSEPLVTGRATAECTVQIDVKPDVFCELEKIAHMQYFSFRVFVSGLRSRDEDGVKVLNVKYELRNASKVSYPEAWPGSSVCYTNGSLDALDDDKWKRNRTTKYTDGKLVWHHTHSSSSYSTFFSYWPCYTYERHMKLIADCAAKTSSLARYDPVVESLGKTLEGREIECLSIGTGDLNAWVQHRQHPGETMAEFYAEGLCRRLFGLEADSELDETTRRVLEKYRIHVVPNMCPDGSVLGHLRTNSVGANLNREWATVTGDYEAPSAERSPEVFAVLSEMDRKGCDFFLDVHGDEELPFVFFSGSEKTPAFDERMQHLHGFFISRYGKANADVQKEIGYPPPDSEADALKYMNVATNQVSNRFRCLGLTLEMPFKDCQTNPATGAEGIGFGPGRAKELGRNLLEALDDVSPYLRNEGDFWKEFDEDSRYVTPTDNFKDDGFVMLKKRFYSDVRPHNN